MDIIVKYEKKSYLKLKKRNVSLPFYEIHPMSQKTNKLEQEKYLHTGIFINLPTNIGYLLFDLDGKQINYIYNSGEILFPVDRLCGIDTKNKIKSIEKIGYILFSYKEDIPITDYNLIESQI